jgi:hypothetical protein
MMLAYARNVLSPGASSKVQSHIGDCKACERTLYYAREILRVEQGSAPAATTFEVAVELSPQVKAKLELVALLHSKQERLTEAVAKLLLPQALWISIEPTIRALRDRSTAPTMGADREDELPVAAFTSGASEQTRRICEKVANVADFVELLCELLVESCPGQRDIGRHLEACVAAATPLLGDLEAGEIRQHKVLGVLSECLSADE